MFDYRYIIIIIFIIFFCSGQGSRVKGGHWEDALVAIVDTQCCWKFGETAELQPSLWWGLFLPPSPSTIQGLGSFPSMPQHPGGAAQPRSPPAGTAALGGCPPALPFCGPGGALSDAWLCSTLMMWFKRSLKNSGTPS